MSSNAVFSNPNVSSPQGQEETREASKATIDLTDGVETNQGLTEGGTFVTTINGTNFTDASQVTFDDIDCTGLAVVDEIQITCFSPPHAPGEVDVTVISEFGSFTRMQFFDYGNRPVVTSVPPLSGPVSGGTSVTINDGHFGTTAGPDGIVDSVNFGGVNVLSFSVINNCQITASCSRYCECRSK